MGVFVAPGLVKAADNYQVWDCFNRSFGHDGLGDACARCVLKEWLICVERQRTADGRRARLDALRTSPGGIPW